MKEQGGSPVFDGPMDEILSEKIIDHSKKQANSGASSAPNQKPAPEEGYPDEHPDRHLAVFAIMAVAAALAMAMAFHLCKKFCGGSHCCCKGKKR